MFDLCEHYMGRWIAKVQSLIPQEFPAIISIVHTSCYQMTLNVYVVVTFQFLPWT